MKNKQNKQNKAIGGYFGWEISRGKSLYHDQLIPLNYGRSALEYILRAKEYKKVYIPYYICDVVLQPVMKLNLEYELYPIQSDLTPAVEQIEAHAALLQVNYFGLMDHRLSELKSKYRELIVDNSMAFFSPPLPSIHAFYSPRKFFGVPDGGFAFIDGQVPDIPREKDISHERTSHLLKRIDVGAEKGFKDFQQHEISSNNPSLLGMSNLTQTILRSVHFDAVRQRRNENFAYLHSHLQSLNEFTPLLDQVKLNGPLVYPFLAPKNPELRKKLIENRIYVAQYWPNIPKWIEDPDMTEMHLFQNLIPLPIDQRYDKGDMDDILKVIRKFYEKTSFSHQKSQSL